MELKKWNININYGIKTGYNDAFIISEQEKNALIAQDEKSADLIRPILRGKNIRKYTFKPSKEFIIVFPCGFTNLQKNEDNPENWFKKNYKSIYDFMVNHANPKSSKSKGLFNREDQGDYWWELRECTYWNDFSKPVIAWQRITQGNLFSLTKKDFVVLDSMAFISNTQKYTYYLLAVLNSKVMYYWMKLNVPQYGDKGFRLSNQFVSVFPVPMPSDNEIEKYDSIVLKYLSSNDQNLLNEIESLICRQYNLSKEEEKYVLNKY